MTSRELIKLLLSRTEHLDAPLDIRCIYNGEANHMRTYDLKEANVATDSNGHSYIILAHPIKS